MAVSERATAARYALLTPSFLPQNKIFLVALARCRLNAALASSSAVPARAAPANHFAPPAGISALRHSVLWLRGGHVGAACLCRHGKATGRDGSGSERTLSISDAVWRERA